MELENKYWSEVSAANWNFKRLFLCRTVFRISHKRCGYFRLCIYIYIHWGERDIYLHHQIDKVKRLEPERNSFYSQGTKRQPAFVLSTIRVVDLHEDVTVRAQKSWQLRDSHLSPLPVMLTAMDTKWRTEPQGQWPEESTWICNSL